MNLKSGLLLKKLILCGHRKNYIVPFQPGINIVYGDADTGKSTILRMVHYLLGGKKIKVDEEVASSVKYAVLELDINGVTYCITRDIYNPNKDIEVSTCKFEDISKSFPDKYKSTVAKGDDKTKSLSDFLLTALGLPTVKLKQAPSRDSSDTARLSFLDLFKFVYLDQDSVGSANMLNIGNYVVETKNREVFKYIFNVLDSGISELDSDISAKSQEKTEQANQYMAISQFLSQTEFETSQDLNVEINSIEELKVETQDRLSDLNSRMTSDNELYEGLKGALNTIDLKIAEYEAIKDKAVRNIERFTRLSNDYQNDINKINASISARELIGQEEKGNTSCPICESVIELADVSEKFDIPEESKLKGEVTSITRRLKDLKKLIIENRDDLQKANSLLAELNTEKKKAREIMDVELESSITPYLGERDIIVKELAKLDERKDKCVQSLRVRNRQMEIADQIGRLESTIAKLKLTRAELEKDAPSIDKILNGLGTDLNQFIEKIHINNHSGVRIHEKTFFPTLRNEEYREINSGGLRTIFSIGYLASILSQKLRYETNMPGLLMIDTVGKFLGKTGEPGEVLETENSEDSEGVSDPQKYRNLFEALVSVAVKFSERNILCQIILVDNDIPQEVAYANQGYEIAHYRSDGAKGLPIGLIDDWEKVKH